jgi:hypothetical protein
MQVGKNLHKKGRKNKNFEKGQSIGEIGKNSRSQSSVMNCFQIDYAPASEKSQHIEKIVHSDDSSDSYTE